jgi:hypothetical protein
VRQIASNRQYDTAHIITRILEDCFLRQHFGGCLGVVVLSHDRQQPLSSTTSVRLVGPLFHDNHFEFDGDPYVILEKILSKSRLNPPDGWAVAAPAHPRPFAAVRQPVVGRQLTHGRTRGKRSAGRSAMGCRDHSMGGMSLES